jgi:outer membrane receptor protein involved in Fe transport
MHDVKTILCAAALMACFGSAAFAQTAATGNIEGVVTDTSGGVLPGVPVIVRNMDTNLVREAETNGDGLYRAPALQPGNYEVSATLSGFSVRPVSNVRVQVGQTVAVDLRMQPAGVAETVSVVAEAPVIDVRRTDVSNIIDQTSIQNLPINGRRWDTFVMLSPGVTNDGAFGLISYRGISGLYNNNMVDGVDNNQAFFSEARGRTRAVYSISSASIKEFQVGVSNMSAEFGRAAGGTVNAVTKSGTNTVAGEAFYFLRDKAFQSRDPFVDQQFWDKIDERRQQFGLALGGPIRRDRVFFFGSYDQQVRDFPPFVNTSASNFYDTCTAPAANCDASRAFFRSLQEVPMRREANNKVFLGKIDWSVNDANTVSINYNGQRWRAPHGIQTPAVITVAESMNGTDIVTTDFVVANLNSIMGARWLNELRVQVGRDYEQQTPNAPGPGTSVTGGIGFGMPNFLPRPKYPFEQRYQILDSVTRFQGGHTLKLGTDINYVKEELQNLFQGGGVYSYTGLTTLATDCPAGASGCTPVVDANTGRHYANYNQAFDLNGLGGLLSFPSWTYAFYAQDTWRATDRLVLNLGLRYEYQQLPQPGHIETQGITFNGNPRFPETMSFHQDKNNWAPRIGLTYDFGAQHATVLRAAYGIFYGLTSNSAVANAITNNGINQASYFFTPSTPGAPTYPNVLTAPPTIGGGRPDLNYFAPDLERPEVHSVDLAIERALPFGMTGSATYMYSKGEKLPFFRDTNFNPANSTVNYVLEGQPVGSFPLYRGARPNTTDFQRMIVMESTVSTRYNALVLAASKRFAEGLMFNTSYTLAKSEDNGQTSATFFGGNLPYDTLTHRSNPVDSVMSTSSNDRRHRYVGSFHYQPQYLWGIGVGGIVTLESGLPITQTISGSLPSTSGATNTTGTNGTGGSFVAPWVGFNADRQPGRKTFDVRFSKRFDVGGRRNVEVLWEVFNLFDTLNPTNLSNTAYSIPTGGATYDAATNVATVNLRRDAGYRVARSASTNFWGPRDMQLGLKFLW